MNKLANGVVALSQQPTWLAPKGEVFFYIHLSVYKSVKCTL